MSQRSGCGFWAFVFGGIAGLIAGLAYAPRPGKDTRERWKERGEDLKEKADELKKKAEDLLEKVEEAWMSTEEWRTHAKERAVELKDQAQDLTKKATREAEDISGSLKERFDDLKTRLKGIQQDLAEVEIDAEGKGKARVALESLKERLHVAREGFSEALHAKETELKGRIDEVVEAEKAKKATTQNAKGSSKKTAAKAASGEEADS